MHSKEQAAQPQSNGENGNHAKVRKTIPIDLEPSKRFVLPSKKRYEPQYAHIYFCRLTALRPALESTARVIFGPPSDKLHHAKRIVNVSSEGANERETVIIGVVFRQMTKPSILALYEQASHDLIPAPPPRATAPYPGADDTVFLEDENGRCTLDMSGFDQIPDAFVTGFVVAVKGKEDHLKGTFKVGSFTPVLAAPQPTLKPYEEDAYICIVSSLCLPQPSFGVELLGEFLKGNTLEEDEAFAMNTVALVITGNVIGHVSDTPTHQPLAVGEKERIASPMVDADRFLSGVASTLPVFYMPGEHDATNYLLPQQAVNRCLLPSASRNSNFHRVPNPLLCEMAGRSLLATSGQNVEDFALYAAESAKDQQNDNQMLERDPVNKGMYEADGERVLEIMGNMLKNRHIAPTCPDTLGSYPFYERDPFVIERTPHIFVAGNQKEFGARRIRVSTEGSQSSDEGMIVEGEVCGTVCLVSAPRFDKSGQAVFVNLRNMECCVREFAVDMQM